MKRINSRILFLPFSILLTFGAGSLLYASGTGQDGNERNGEYTFAEEIMDFLVSGSSNPEIRIMDSNDQGIAKYESDDAQMRSSIFRDEITREIDAYKNYLIIDENGIQPELQMVPK